MKCCTVLHCTVDEDISQDKTVSSDGLTLSGISLILLNGSDFFLLFSFVFLSITPSFFLSLHPFCVVGECETRSGRKLKVIAVNNLTDWVFGV